MRRERRSRSLAARTGAILVDLVALTVVLWLGLVTTLSVLRGVDNAIRFHILGQLPAVTLIPNKAAFVDYNKLRVDLAAHPMIMGRPVLAYFLNIIGAAAFVLLYVRFSQAICGGKSLGGLLADIGHERINRSVVHEVEGSIDEIAGRLHESLIDAILQRLKLASWIEGFEKLRDLLSPVRSLPRAMRVIGLGAMLTAIAISVATAIIALPQLTLTQITFNGPNGAATIARISLYLALIALAIGWAAAIAGAVVTDLWLLLLMALFYVFTVSFIGLTGGRAWWVVTPQWTMVALAAASPRRKNQRLPIHAVLWMLTVLAVFHTFRLTGLGTLKGGPWPWIKSWPATIALATALTAACARVRRELTVRQAFLFVATITAGFLAISLRAGERLITDSVYNSSSILMTFLVTFWFLLGRNFVSACIEITRNAVKAGSNVFGTRAMPRVLIASCLIELSVIAILQLVDPNIVDPSSTSDFLKYQVAIPVHQGIALAMLAAAAVMSTADALTPRRATWMFAAWAFSLAMVVVHFGALLSILHTEAAKQAGQQVQHGISSTAKISAAQIGEQFQKGLSSAAKLGAILIVSFGIVLETMSGRRRFSTDESGLSPSAMLVYAGLLALLAALTHLVIISKTYPADVVAAYTIQGMTLMWPAMAILAALSALGRPKNRAQGAIARALLAGAAASVVTDLIRRSFGDPATLLTSQQLIAMASGEIAIVACVVAIVTRGRSLTAFDAVCVGVACAFGFVIAYVGELIVPILTILIAVPSHMIGFRPGIALTETWLHYLPFGAQGNPVPHADLMIFYVLVPALAALAGFACWCRMREPSTWLQLLAAAAIVAAPLYAIHVYEIPILLIGFGQEMHETPLHLGRLHDAYFWAGAYLALPAILIASFIYRRIRQPAKIGTIEAGHLAVRMG